jgi:hypothetical protein
LHTLKKNLKIFVGILSFELQPLVLQQNSVYYVFYVHMCVYSLLQASLIYIFFNILPVYAFKVSNTFW